MIIVNYIMSQEIYFTSLNIPIPSIVESYSIEKQSEIFEYLSEMDDLNKKAYKIAFDQLKSSFDICNSNGFIKWKSLKLSK